VTISWDNVNAMNRKIIDRTSHRYYFVPDPIRTKVSGVKESKDIHAPLHPQYSEMGSRTLRLQSLNDTSTLLLAGSDRALLVSGNVVRLMGLFNMRPVGFSDGELGGECLGESITKAENVPILQWVPDEHKLPVTVVMPDDTQTNGFAEEGLRAEPVGSVIQFVRFGFGRIDEIKADKVTVYFAHE
jgi:glutamyl-tRNA synthetase